MEEKRDNQITNTSLTVLDVILIFLKYKKKIIITTAVVCVISILLYFFVFDLIYKSTASIKSSGKSGGLLSSIEGLPDIGGLDEIGLGGGKSAKELASYKEILTSRRCLEPLIIKFGLMERDAFRFMEDAIKNFREEKLDLSEEKLAGVLKIDIYDKDPVLAKEMVEFLLGELDKINIELNVLSARNNKEFIERRYFQAKSDLTKAEDSLKSFQFIYGISPELQVKAAAQTMFSIEAELKGEEVKLDVLKKILSLDQNEVKLQEAKVNSLRDKVSGIRTSTDLNDILSLGNSPQIVLAYLRLQREVEIQTKILSFLLPVYEQAKIEEKRETPTVLVLDKPYVAERKSKPKRLTMVVVLTFVGFMFSSAYYILKSKWRQYKSLMEKSDKNSLSSL